MSAQHFIQSLALQPHPEGGYYKETYRAAGTIPGKCLPPSFGSDRSYSTAIYFLLQEGNFSAFHRINSDECWHFYEGGPLLIHVLDADGNYSYRRLGKDITKGEVFQAIVPANCWFASEPAPGSSFSLVGCTVAPGFDFADFEMAEKLALTKLFPQHAFLTERLCR